MSQESVVQMLPEVPHRDRLAGNKLDEVCSSLHHVSQTNAILRKKLEQKMQTAKLTRENLLYLEEIYEKNKPAVWFEKKRFCEMNEFIGSVTEKAGIY